MNFLSTVLVSSFIDFCLLLYFSDSELRLDDLKESDSSGSSVIDGFLKVDDLFSSVIEGFLKVELFLDGGGLRLTYFFLFYSF